ncbi:MAG TPA: hypothetical protein P5077_03490 [bacterium]|nr:hypothetical protein [bacterium]
MKRTTEKTAPRSKKKVTAPPPENTAQDSMSAEERAVRKKRKTKSYFPDELKKKTVPCEKCGHSISFDEEIEETGDWEGVFRTYKECPHCGKFYAMAGIFEYLDEPPRRDPVTGKMEQERRKILWPKEVFTYPHKPESWDTMAWASIMAKCMASIRLRS